MFSCAPGAPLTLVTLSHHFSQFFPKFFFPVVMFFIPFFSLAFSFGPAFSFGRTFSLSLALALSFGLALFRFRFLDRGRSIFEVPRRGSQPPGSDPRAPGSTTSISSLSHKSLGSIPRITPRSLAIGSEWYRQSEPSIATKGHANDTGLAFAITQPRLTERFRHGHVGPEFSDHFASVARRFPDEVVPLRNNSNHTEHPLSCMTTNSLECTKTSLLKEQLLHGLDIPQHPDYGPILPNLGRSCIFHFTTTPSLKTGSSARDLRPKGSDNDGTGREGVLISHCNPENIEHSPVTINIHSPTPEEGPLNRYKALSRSQVLGNQEGTHQPGMVGI